MYLVNVRLPVGGQGLTQEGHDESRGSGAPVELGYRNRLLQAVGLEGGNDAKDDAEDGSGVQGSMQHLALPPAWSQFSGSVLCMFERLKGHSIFPTAECCIR